MALKRTGGNKFKNSITFQTCESGGNNNTLLPPEIMFGDGDDRLRFVAPYALRGSIEKPDGTVLHQLEPLNMNESNFLTIREVGTETIGYIALRSTLN